MSVYKDKKEWRKWNEMVLNSLNAIEDFRDFADDRAIVRADKKIQSLRSKKYNLERQLEEAREESKLKKDLISQVSKICLLLQMGKLPSQEDFKELMSLERAYRTFEEQ